MVRLASVVFCTVCIAAAGPNVPIFFFVNSGQAPISVRFIAKGSGVTAYFLAREIELHAHTARIRMQFQGANPAAALEGAGRLPGRVNFLIGHRSGWHRDLPTFGAIRYRNLYPGIDMIYGSALGRLKSQFIVAPGADPGQIRIRYRGAPASYYRAPVMDRGAKVPYDEAPVPYREAPVPYRDARVEDDPARAPYRRARVEDDPARAPYRQARVEDDPARVPYRGAPVPAIQVDGSLSLVAGDQTLIEAAPYIYQEFSGTKATVEGRYVIHQDGSVGFALGHYDPARTLIIDPLITYSTLVGTNNFNAATAIAVDSAGAVYIAGYTDSDALPTANPAQNFNLGSVEAFVAKLNPAGNTLEYCTYMGGSDDDRAYGIAVDSSGSAYVTGTATSPDFPTRNAEQSSLEGSRNAFVFKLNALGDILEFSTFLGGSGADTAYGIAIDSSRNSYIVGDTTSLNFPANGYQTANRGSQDAFVTKLSSTGQQLLFSTYLGGAGADHGGAIAVDSSGTVYVTGYTWSSNFPTQNAYQPSIAGPCNAYVARFSASGDSLLFSTYLGGSGCTMAYPETGQAIALGAQENAYVAGVTSSSDFPQLNAVQPQLQGSTDVFVAEFNSAGALMFSTYLGGSGVDVGNAIALDASGAIYVAGYTYSTDFPVTAGAIQLTNAGVCDAFLFKLSPMGDTLLYATYVGGSGADTASGVALDSNGNVYLGGWTLSSNFPVVRSGS